MTKSEINKPWWRQLWPWLLISGPAAAIVACAITIWLDVNTYPDQQLHEGIVSRGLKTEQVKK